jgi:hypothetical protein
MGNEIVRFDPNNRRLVPADNSRRVMNEALERLRRADGVVLPKPKTELVVQQQNPAPLLPRVNGEVIDLPRLCAVHDRYYVARYIRDSKGQITFAQTIRMVDSLRDQYEGPRNGIKTLLTSQLHDEYCPWCGAHGYGAVKCGKCHAEVCFGRSDTKGNFRCTDRCGGHGKMVEQDWIQKGLVPGIRSNVSLFSK